MRTRSVCLREREREKIYDIIEDLRFVVLLSRERGEVLLTCTCSEYDIGT